MPDITFTLDGWSEYTAWQAEDKRTLKKINALVKDITSHDKACMICGQICCQARREERKYADI